MSVYRHTYVYFLVILTIFFWKADLNISEVNIDVFIFHIPLPLSIWLARSDKKIAEWSENGAAFM